MTINTSHKNAAFDNQIKRPLLITYFDFYTYGNKSVRFLISKNNSGNEERSMISKLARNQHTLRHEFHTHITIETLCNSVAL